MRIRIFLCYALFLCLVHQAVAEEACHVPNFEVTRILFGDEAERGLPSDASSVSFSFPVAGTPTLNSQFGPRQLGAANRRYDWHRGMDISLPIGTQILAPADAVVVHAGTHPGFSDTIIQLRHNTAEPFVYTLYLHLDSVLVSAGNAVDAGDPIALSGQGSASYPHLHWEVRNGCLLQECNEITYSWQLYGNAAAPATPQLEAAGDLPGLGRLVMYSTGVPKDEVDLEELQLTWGSDTITANLNQLNSLSPTGQGSRLDDPLFFFENHAFAFAILPERFNSFYPSADYNFLAWGLAGGVSSGTATATDAGGMSAVAPLSLNLPPLSLTTPLEQVTVATESTIAIPFAVVNNDSIAHTVSLAGISAQSIALDVSPAGGSIAPGATLDVTVSGQLGDWPEGVGDIILLRAEVTTGSFTDLIGAALIETSAPAGFGGRWKLY